ncbi:MAG: hypothetical protein H6723_04790 [Sandaracinus sp.]|nr:hypothetical protein [Sandaracinus sp.]
MPNPVVPSIVLLREGETSDSSTAPRPREVSPPSGPSFTERLGAAARQLDAGRRVVDAALATARRGDLAPEQLLAIQAGVYRYTQEVELASKVVDKATNGLKTVLQSQQ